MGEGCTYSEHEGAGLNFTLSRDNTVADHFLSEDCRIGFCPFCGADLKMVRDYMEICAIGEPDYSV